MDSLMDSKVWSRAWALFMTDPVPFGTVLVALVGLAFGGAWFRRGHIAK